MFRSLLPALLVFFLGFVAFASTLGFGFTYDDHMIVEENRLIRDLDQAAVIFDSPYWVSFLSVGVGIDEAFGLYRPLTILSFAIDYAAFGIDPFFFHLMNVVLHGIVSVLVWNLMGCPAFGFRRNVALLIGILFALHPVHTEVVAGVVGRAEILSALFGLLCLRFRLGASEGNPWRRWVFSVFSLGFFFLALLSKENAVAVPLALLSIEVLRAGGVRRIRARWIEHLLYYGAITGLFFVFWFLLRYPVTGQVTTVQASLLDNVIPHLPFVAGILTSLGCLFRAFFLCFVPIGLSADYSYPQIEGPSWQSLDLWGLLVLGLGIFIFRKHLLRTGGASRRWILPGVGLFFAFYFPVSNLVLRIGTVFAERLLYLPSLGACILVAGWFLAGTRPRSRTLRVGMMVLLLGAFAFGTALRNGVWRDDATLYSSLVKTAPRSARSHFIYGQHLVREGGRRQEAVRELEKALSLYGDYDHAREALGSLLASMGKVTEALGYYQALVEKHPELPSLRLKLAELLVEEGRVVEAGREFVEVLRRAPDDPGAHHGLGRLEFSEGRRKLRDPAGPAKGRKLVLSALHHFTLSISRDPGRLSAVYDRGVAREALGRYLQAAEDYSLVAESLSESLPIVLVRLAFCRLMVDGPASGTPAESIDLVEEALRLSGRSPAVLSASQRVLEVLETRRARPELLDRLRAVLAGS